MTAQTPMINTLNDLRTYIHQTICEQNELIQSAFQMTERILVRGGKPCGVFFCVHGPRSVKLTAIWESEQNTILFYGSSGQRLLKTALVTTPQLAYAA